MSGLELSWFPSVLSLLLLSLLLHPGLFFYELSHNFPKGHLNSFGEHTESSGFCTSTTKVPHPKEFYDLFVKKQKPLLMKGLAKKMNAYKKWKYDKYLNDTFGHIEITYEINKKENRNDGSNHTSLSDFLSFYNDSDVFMVTELNEEMAAELEIPIPIRQGGYWNHAFHTAVWFRYLVFCFFFVFICIYLFLFLFFCIKKKKKIAKF